MRTKKKSFLLAMIGFSFFLQGEETSLPNEPESLKPNYEQQVRHYKDINWNCFIELEFLYMQASIDSLSFAQTGLGRQDPAGDLLGSLDPSPGRIHSVNWQWDPGFRVKLGYSFNKTNWNVSLSYLWFYTKTSPEQVSASPLVGAVTPTFNLLDTANSLSSTQAEFAQADWDLRYQVITFALSRNYLLENVFKISPFFGVLATWQKQHYHLLYQELSFITSEAVFDSSSRFRQSNWGIGPRVGLNALWQIKQYMGFYAKLALSGVWLHYDVLRKDFLSLKNPVPEELSSLPGDTGQSLNNVKSFIEITAGILIDPSVNFSNFNLHIQVGWEAQIWLNHTLYVNLYENLSRFDLDINGLIAKIRFEF